MPLTKTDATVSPYVRQNPGDTKDLNLFTLSELRRIEKTLSQLTLIANQVYVVEPKTKVAGMIVRNKAPWDPVGAGDGWVKWDGATWTALTGAASTGLTHPQVMSRISLRF